MRTAEQARANPMVGDKWEYRWDRTGPRIYAYTLTTKKGNHWYGKFLPENREAACVPGVLGETYLGNDILDNQNIISKKDDTNMNKTVIISLALSTTKDATVQATRIPEGPLRQAFVDAQEEREAQRRKQLGNEVLSIITEHDQALEASDRLIRSLKSQLNTAYSKRDTQNRTFQYGMETGNFVPWLTQRGEAYCPSDVTPTEWDALKTIPTDWKPGT